MNKDKQSDSTTKAVIIGTAVATAGIAAAVALRDKKNRDKVIKTAKQLTKEAEKVIDLANKALHETAMDAKDAIDQGSKTLQDKAEDTKKMIDTGDKMLNKSTDEAKKATRSSSGR